MYEYVYTDELFTIVAHVNNSVSAHNWSFIKTLFAFISITVLQSGHKFALGTAAQRQFGCCAVCEIVIWLDTYLAFQDKTILRDFGHEVIPLMLKEYPALYPIWRMALQHHLFFASLSDSYCHHYLHYILERPFVLMRPATKECEINISERDAAQGRNLNIPISTRCLFVIRQKITVTTDSVLNTHTMAY